MRLTTNYGVITTDEAFEIYNKTKDLKIAVDSRYTKVNSTDLRECRIIQRPEKRDVYRISTQNGRSLEFTADHLFSTPKGWKKVEELRDGDEIHIQSNGIKNVFSDYELGFIAYQLQDKKGYKGQYSLNAKSFNAVKHIFNSNYVRVTENTDGVFNFSKYHPLISASLSALKYYKSDEFYQGYLASALAVANSKGFVFCQEKFVKRLEKAVNKVFGTSLKGIVHSKKKNSISYRFRIGSLSSLINKFNPSVSDSTDIDLDYAFYGWLMADGHLTADSSMSVGFNTSTDSEAQELLLPVFNKYSGYDLDKKSKLTYSGKSTDVYSSFCFKRDKVNNLHKLLGLDSYKEKNLKVPEFIFKADLNQQASFLSAVFSADGSVKKYSASLSSASEQWLRDIQLLLLNFGIHSRITLPQTNKAGSVFYNLNIKQHDGIAFAKLIGFKFSAEKQSNLNNRLLSKNHWKKYDTSLDVVSNIESIGKQIVYDIEEPTTNTLIVEGAVVHNCLLGSIMLHKFVINPFQDNAKFDFVKYNEVIKVFTRMLDNVVEMSGLPLEKQRWEIENKRRHGMGYLGLGSALAMMRIKYGSKEAIEFTEKVTKELAMTGFETGIELAKEKGMAPILSTEFKAEDIQHYANINKNTNWKKDKKKYLGKDLLVMSHYFDAWRDDDRGQDILKNLAKYGCRFSHHSSIAPTGTISASFGENCSNGIEPSFDHSYIRNVIVAGNASKQDIETYSYEFYEYKKLNPEVTPSTLPDYFVVTDKLKPREHVDMQAAAQKWIDSSISKCVAEGTRILTNKGLLRVEDIGNAKKLGPGSFGETYEKLKVFCPDGVFRKIKSHYYDGFKKTIKVRFNNGLIIEGSIRHKLMTNKGWKKLKDLNVDDIVICRLNTKNKSKGGLPLPPMLMSVNAKNIIYPQTVNTDFCLFIGMLLADGHLEESTGAVSISKKNSKIIKKAANLMFSLFGRKANITKDSRTSVLTATINSKPLARWLSELCGNRAATKFVPEAIMQGSKEEHIALLSGISLDGYKVNNGHEQTVLYEGISETLAKNIFTICTALSYSPYLGTKYVKSHDYYTYGVRISGFSECLQKHKNSKVAKDYLVPLPDDIRSMALSTSHPKYSWLRNIKRRTEQQTCLASALTELSIPYDENFYVIKVTDISEGEAHLYDIEVEDTHDYLIDGVWSHNTINVPTDIPFEEFKDVYLYGYEKGLKGCFDLDSELNTVILANGKTITLKQLFSLGLGTKIRTSQYAIGTVTKLFDNGIAHVNRYTFSNGKSIDCTPDHIFETLDGKELPIQEIYEKGLQVKSITNDIYGDSLPDLLDLDLGAGEFLVPSLGNHLRYSVSSKGRVWRHLFGKSKNNKAKWLKPTISSNYLRLRYTNADGDKSQCNYHSFIADTFIPNTDISLNTVNHIDGDKNNFHPNNLERCNLNYNLNHRSVNELQSKSSTGYFGVYQTGTNCYYYSVICNGEIFSESKFTSAKSAAKAREKLIIDKLLHLHPYYATLNFKSNKKIEVRKQIFDEDYGLEGIAVVNMQPIGNRRVVDLRIETEKNDHIYLINGIRVHNCTTFRFNPEVFTGVLVKKDDLKKTKYRFNLKDGSYVEVTGDQYVMYEGQQHLASNLADALKNGYYKKL